MNLDFKPLDGLTSFIDNAVVPVSEHFQLSVSKNRSEGMWYVGEKDSYEAAIQVIDNDLYPGQGASLVTFEDNPSYNVWHDCNMAKLQALVDRAKTLTYCGSITVFDVIDRNAKESTWPKPQWIMRFMCAEGYDFKDKLKYTRRIWGKGKYKVFDVTGKEITEDV